ncbi:MAG: hypothetical protein U5R49_12905 [Deltaproteobacteria bacterium]|nr:hypothetical protein [Deltaproteobacteria bacterium]
MKCISCRQRFKGDTFDPCPNCRSYLTEEDFSLTDIESLHEDRPNMVCLDCGHRFSGDIFQSCPQCLSPDTEEIDDETDNEYW